MAGGGHKKRGDALPGDLRHLGPSRRVRELSVCHARENARPNVTATPTASSGWWKCITCRWTGGAAKEVRARNFNRQWLPEFVRSKCRPGNGDLPGANAGGLGQCHLRCKGEGGFKHDNSYPYTRPGRPAGGNQRGGEQVSENLGLILIRPR